MMAGCVWVMSVMDFDLLFISFVYFCEHYSGLTSALQLGVSMHTV